jgi:Integrase core domain
MAPYPEPGKPTQNAVAESSNARLGDELVNETLVHSLCGSRRLIEAWRADYDPPSPALQAPLANADRLDTTCSPCRLSIRVGASSSLLATPSSALHAGSKRTSGFARRLPLSTASWRALHRVPEGTASLSITCWLSSLGTGARERPSSPRNRTRARFTAAIECFTLLSAITTKSAKAARAQGTSCRKTEAASTGDDRFLSDLDGIHRAPPEVEDSDPASGPQNHTRTPVRRPSALPPERGYRTDDIAYPFRALEAIERSDYFRCR